MSLLPFRTSTLLLLPVLRTHPAMHGVPVAQLQRHRPVRRGAAAGEQGEQQHQGPHPRGAPHLGLVPRAISAVLRPTRSRTAS